jgi:hypothetical protein
MLARNDGRQSTHHHADEPLLVGWMAGAPGSYDDNAESTHRHADEPLLVGWMAGAPGSYDDNAKLQHRQAQTSTPNTTNNDGHPPTPTAAVSLQARRMMDDDGEGRGGEGEAGEARTNATPRTTTQHPPPAL